MRFLISTNILLFLFLSVSPVSYADSVRCDICGKFVSGSYTIYTDPATSRTITVCSKCNSSCPRCDLCNTPVKAGSLRKVGNSMICPSCRRTAKVCSNCGNLIRGRYWQIEGQQGVFCQHCFNILPRCDSCGAPMKQESTAYNVHGKSICSNCWKNAERCRACGLPIIKKYYEYKYIDGKFCENCQKNRKHCHTCGVPVGNTYWDIFDGRVMCEECHATSINDLKKANMIYKEVKSILKNNLGIELKRTYDFKLVYLKSGEPESPISINELGLYKENANERTIYILTSLPKAQFYETVAHELTHAWQAENTPRLKRDEIREGMAQWVAAKVLEYKGYGYKRKLAHLEERTDYPYGTGYKKVKNIAARINQKEVMNYFIEYYSN